jgi:hypothetical protein
LVDQGANRLGWVPADEKEEPALAAVRERLRDEGESTMRADLVALGVRCAGAGDFECS